MRDPLRWSRPGLHDRPDMRRDASGSQGSSCGPGSPPPPRFALFPLGPRPSSSLERRRLLLLPSPRLSRPSLPPPGSPAFLLPPTHPHRPASPPASHQRGPPLLLARKLSLRARPSPSPAASPSRKGVPRTLRPWPAPVPPRSPRITLTMSDASRNGGFPPNVNPGGGGGANPGVGGGFPSNQDPWSFVQASMAGQAKNGADTNQVSLPGLSLPRGRDREKDTERGRHVDERPESQRERERASERLSGAPRAGRRAPRLVSRLAGSLLLLACRRGARLARSERHGVRGMRSSETEASGGLVIRCSPSSS